MTCPYCESPVTATTEECATCHLTFPKTCALFGAIPRTHQKIFDATNQLTKAQQNEIKKHIVRLCGKYPQLYVQIILQAFPPPHPMRTQVFWLFNAAAFSGETLQGPDNHTLFLAIDPGTREVAIMPGYGLEPFLDETALNELLDSAADQWKNGNWSNGIHNVLNSLDQQLELITQPVDRNQSLPDEF